MKSSPDPIEARFPTLRRLVLWQKRARIPIVRQLAATDCGAAVLAMVLGYFGKEVSLDELKRALGPGRDGTTAASILRVGRAYGLRGRGVRLEVEQLSELPSGAILYWEFRHFVVFERFHRKHVSIIDPASGRLSVPLEKFRRSFTGVAVLFEPCESFERGGVKSKRISGWLKQILEQRDLVTRMVSSSLLIQVLSAIVPLFTGIVIDRVVPHKDYSLLLVLTIGYCVFQLFNLLAGFIRANLLVHLRTRVEARFTLRFLDHLVDLPYSFFQQHTSGDLMVRLGSNNTVREILTSTTLSAMLDGTMAILYLAFLIIVSFQLTLIVVLLAAARFLLLWAIRWRQRQLLAESLINQSRSQTYEVEMLSGMETLKAMGLEHRAAESWSHLFVDGLNISIKLGRLDALSSGLLSLLSSASSLVFLFYGALLVLKGELTLGTMMAFSALAAGLLGPLNNVVSAALQLQMLDVYLERLNDVMDTPPEQDSSAVAFSGTLSGAVTLERVSFRYGSHSPTVIHDLSINIAEGARVALVGRTGCGKSTLARLIAGLYDPSSGRILFDGKDLTSLDRRSVRSQLGIVTQETQLFGGSIRRNIALADSQMTLDLIVRAAKLAEIHDEIMQMSMGYETTLTDRGLSLSGGQRQRLALARALVRSPRILILDEATSHLDAVTEERISKNLSSLNCSQIIIAHRLSTIRDADVVLLLEDGRVIEQGTHDSLMRARGIYEKLFAAQHERTDRFSASNS
jgi:ATP-binding cassette, subfamily B, bacterial